MRTRTQGKCCLKATALGASVRLGAHFFITLFTLQHPALCQEFFKISLILSRCLLGWFFPNWVLPARWGYRFRPVTSCFRSLGYTRVRRERLFRFRRTDR